MLFVQLLAGKFHPNFVNESNMRDIIFRGKCIHTGMWIYGYLSRLGDGAYITTNPDGYRIDYQVKPETIGMCTGLQDKNDKLIYEGDMLVYNKNGHNSRPLVVEYRHGAFGYVYSNEWFHPFAGNTKFDFNPCDKDDRFEIIGDIYE